MTAFTEATVESAALGWLSELGWQVKHDPEIARGGLFAERQDYGQVVFEQHPRDALLPKLISGELRVKDVEWFLEERGL